MSSAPATNLAPARHGRMHLLMLVVVICWSANIVAAKEGSAGFGAVALAQFRTIGAALFFALFFIAWPGRPALRLKRHEWTFFAVMALSGVTLNQLWFIGGAARTSVAHSALIIALGPVLVLMLASLMRLEELTTLKLAGMAVSFVGVGVLTLSREHHTSAAHLSGDLIQLAATAVFAYYTILMKKAADRFDALTINTLAFVLGAILMLPYSAHSIWKLNWSRVGSPALWSLVFMIIPGTILSYLLYAYALTGLAASRAAAFSYLEPIIATLLGRWILAEKVTFMTVVGGVLILIGVFLAEREPREGERIAGAPGKELSLWI